MWPLAKSFWQECRRARNDKLKRELGVTLRYPTYREGLRALFEQEGADVFQHKNRGRGISWRRRRPG